MKAIVTIMTTTALVVSPKVCSLSDYQGQIKTSISIINAELNKIETAHSLLSPEDRDKLNRTHIGDEGMSEQDILNVGRDMTDSGLNSYIFYIRHLSKPIKKDKVGEYYR